MSLSPRCPFCMKLPVTRNPRMGRPSKCPLCKADTLIAPGSQVSYRLQAEERPPVRTAGRSAVLA